MRAASTVLLPQPGPAMMPSGPSPAVMAACWDGVKPSFTSPGPPGRWQAVPADPCRGSAASFRLRKISMELSDCPDFCLDVVGAVLGWRGVVATRQLLTDGAGSRLAIDGGDHHSGRPRTNGDNGHLERARRLLPAVARLDLVQIGCYASVFGSRRTNGHSPASSGVIPGPGAIKGISVTVPSTV